jgi:GNAT superfamily N-acetyltransferase
MLEDWYRPIEVTIPFEQWALFPKLLGYRNEYFDGRAVWTPRPKAYNAVLHLDRFACDDDECGSPVSKIVVRGLREEDWDTLALAFDDAFQRVSPFCSLTNPERMTAATDCLAHTRRGGDGEFLSDASVVATDDAGRLVGALLVTRWTYADGSDTAGTLRSTESTDAHITWAFVRQIDAGHGIGTRMLVEAVCRLRDRHFAKLYTTFMSGNEPSLLWHWRNGFTLLPHPLSPRELRRRWIEAPRDR